MFLVAAAFWVVREARRASVRRAVLPELARVGIEPMTFGLTATGLAATIALGHEGGEAWLRDHLGEGWFSRPVEFRAEGLSDDGVAYAVERLRRLGRTHAMLIDARGLTEHGVTVLREALPDTYLTLRGPAGDRQIPPRNRRLWRW
jgi:hypothetical protein